MTRRLALVWLVFSFAPVLGAAPRRAAHPATSSNPRFEPWAFRENFAHGIPGWMSFPLVQDVGYDPSIYTSSGGGAPVLVRDVTAQGDRLLHVGLIRELRFRASPSSTFELDYTVSMCGNVTGMEIILASPAGRRYTAALPGQRGEHRIGLKGQQFQIPPGGIEVEAIVIQVQVAAPTLGSHNRLVLRGFRIEADQPARVIVEEPQLERSPVDGVAIARNVVTAASPLVVRVGPGPSARVAFYDPAGNLVQQAEVSAAGKASGGPGEEKKEARTREGVFFRVTDATRPGLWKAEITRGAARRSFRFLVLGKVPAHPRVLLGPSRLNELRSQSYSNELLAIVHRKAGSLGSAIHYNPEAGENIARLSPDSVFPGLPDYFSLLETYSQAIAFNALESRIAGDDQAFEAARRALLTVAAWRTWTPPWFEAHGLHTYYEVGVFTQRVAFGYDLIADRLSPEDKERILQGLWRNSVLPTVEEYFLYDRMPIAASNHMANSVGGAIAACVAAYGDVPDWASWFGPALAELITAYERLLRNLFPGDGSEAEPAGYENFAMQGMSWGAAALEALGIHPAGMEGMRQAFWWLRYAQVRPGFFLDTGDFGGQLQALSGFAWVAETGGDAQLQAFYEAAKDRSLMGVFRLRHTGRTLEAAPGLLDLICCTRAAPAVPDPTPSRVFPLRGSAILRSGWRPEDTVVSIRVGPWFNHEHHDQGSFQVAAFGEPLVSEAGYADYYKDPRYQDYFTQAPAHNTVVVDSGPFSQAEYDGRYWEAFEQFPRFASQVLSGSIDYLAADLAPAYGTRLEAFTREFLFLKPHVLIIHDHLKAYRPHRYTWFLHVPRGAQASADGDQGFIRGHAGTAVLLAGGAVSRWSLGPTPISIGEYGHLDNAAIALPEAFRLDSPSAKKGNFLVAIHLQQASQAARPLQFFRNSSGEGFRSADGAVTAVFRTGAGPLVAGEFTTDGTVLAWRKRGDSREIFVARARVLRRGRSTLFASPVATDAALADESSGVRLAMNCPVASTVRFSVDREPRGMTVDGVRTVPRTNHGYVWIAALSAGEHVVRVDY